MWEISNLISNIVKEIFEIIITRRFYYDKIKF